MPLADVPLRLWIVVQVLVLGFTLWRIGEGVSGLEAAGLVVSMGLIAGGGGINVAHELMHRKARGDRALAEILMASVTYTWFCVEHVLGHHRNVATPLDAASSRAGETFWAFLPRVVTRSFASFWGLEATRIARRGIRAGSPADRRARYLAGLVALYAGLALIGWPAVLLFAAQSAVAITLLEVINYVEHYGLQRTEVAPGRYERVGPQHSWNSNHALTSAFLFNLPRHADHHANASRPYWALRAFPDAPELPLGYPTMVMIALVPPLWFRIMDPRLEAARVGTL
jgi:alkane 1-monooxygenase